MSPGENDLPVAAGRIAASVGALVDMLISFLAAIYEFSSSSQMRKASENAVSNERPFCGGLVGFYG